MTHRARNDSLFGELCPSFQLAALVFALSCLALFSCGRTGAAGSTTSPLRSPETAAGAARVGRMDSGVVSYLEGKATLIRAKAESKLDMGDSVSGGDSVRTGSKSKCEISFPGIGKIFMQPDTVVEISKLDLVSRRAQVSANSGSVLAKVKKLAGKDDFMIRTPSVTCGVRGTAFSVGVGKKGARVAVAEGVVALYPDALVSGGLYSPGSPDSIPSEDALAAFPLLKAGEASLCDAESFRQAGASLSGIAPGKESDAALKTSASLLVAPAAPISASEKRALEEFMARPEAQEPPYLLSTSPAARAEESPASKTDWPNFGYWNRKPVDISALPRMDAKAFYLSLDKGGKAVASQDGDNVLFDVTEPVPDAPWNVQALFPATRLEKGAFYRMRLVAWADAPHLVNAYAYEPNVDLDGDGNSYSALGKTLEFPLGTQAQLYTFVFRYRQATRTDIQSSFTFGSRKGKVWLRELKIDRLGDREAAEYETAYKEMGLTSRLPFNGDFSRGMHGWGTFAFEKEQYGGFSATNGAFRFEQEKASLPAWHASISPEKGLDIRKGARYRLEFDMRADPAAGEGRAMEIRMDENGKDVDGDGSIWTIATPVMFAPAAAEWTHFRFAFPSYADLPDARLLFSLSDAGSWIEIDNVSFEEIE